MHTPPNELYSAFSFIGFVLSAIPFYWHLKARNTGTCLYMIWTGLGCLIQCVNSIVWNKNMINRAPVYCDISARIQVAQNVAIPACSLCINRQLYRVARMKASGITDAENRRILIIDLLIAVGIPVLQMIVQYVFLGNRYIIFEDLGPIFSMWITLPTFFVFYAWPVAIGTVSFFYCVMAICGFYKRRCNLMKLMSGHNGGQYLRLMAISATEMLATIPLGTYFIVTNAKSGVVPWKGWAYTHSHSSEVKQIAGFIWKNEPLAAINLEMFRWLLVACAFIFFALFGFTGEACEHYYRLYMLLARRIGKSTSTLHGAPHATPSVSKRDGGITDPIVVQIGRDKDDLSLSLTHSDQLSVLSISMESGLNSDSTTVQDLHSDTMSFYTAKSFGDLWMHDEYKSAPPPGILQTVRLSSLPTAPPPAFLPTIRPVSVTTAPPPGFLPTLRPSSIPLPPPPGLLPVPCPISVRPHFPDATGSTVSVHTSSGVETV